MPTLHHVKICVHFLPTHGPPKLSKIVDGWDAETGQRWIVVMIWVPVGPPPANDNVAIKNAA